MKLPIGERITLAQKMLPELDPLEVADAVLEMRLLPDAAVSATFDKHLASKKMKAALESHRRALRKALYTRAALLRDAGAAFGVIAALSNEELLREDLAMVERMLSEHRAQRPTRFDPIKRVAVRSARMLLLRARRRVIIARKSDWCKLTAILYGEPFAL
jgi:hypothetical protein